MRHVLRCNGVTWRQVHPGANTDYLGFIPEFVSEMDPSDPVEQFNERYSSGWHEFKGFKASEHGWLKYPGDPEMRPLYEAELNGYTIRVYESAWVAVFAPDGTFRVARID